MFLWLKSFLKLDISVTRALRSFKRCLNLKHHDPVFSYRSVMLWVQQFRATSSAFKPKPSGKYRAVELQIMTSVSKSQLYNLLLIQLASMLQFTHHCQTNFDLKFHPYKIMVVQELHQYDYLAHASCCEEILQKVS